MQADPIAEWQRLTQLYREMGDGELEALDADKGDLTEVAQQVLDDEVRTRGLDKLDKLNKLDKPSGPTSEADASKRFASPTWNSHSGSTTDGEATEEGDEPVEYTWKTPLCECEDREEAWQLQEMLRVAGIASWIEGPGYQIGHELSYPRIVVAADQLEKAHEVISQPISQEIVEQSKSPVEEYVPPVCPSCGTEDPILESADPVNSWRCESCGRQWSDTAEDAKDSMAQQQSTLNPSQVENPFDTGPMLIG
jgi:ribosomal protein L37AE/L43A